MTILVLALGNPLLGDEGVGLRALELLKSSGGLPPSVELLDGGTSGLSLLPQLRAASKVLVLDAVRAGMAPGTVVKLDGMKLGRVPLEVTSPHQLGLSDLVAACRLAGGPEEIVVLGVEPESMSLGVGLSASVSQALEKLVAEALGTLGAWEGSRCTSSR